MCVSNYICEHLTLESKLIQCTCMYVVLNYDFPYLFVSYGELTKSINYYPFILLQDT